ncbi:dipeptide ABC transporter ATP-binding protein [Falsiroseomonas sp.]|uniref:dipeptide ABC transporter ATP-binding protein n=1 Tax=Falsiroseomonas sp. TaxID=2870721 RepID=UPI0034A1E833
MDLALAVPTATQRKATPLLALSQLTVDFATRGGGMVRVVHGIDLDIMPGETLGLVGESGSGKSVSCLAALRLLPGEADISGGITFAGDDVTRLSPARLQSLRGGRIAIVFQDPAAALNPTQTIGWQLRERLVRHQGLRGAALQAAAIAALARVGIADPAQRLEDYPHHLSGGMCQRAMIAMALTGKPELLIADEPTTALDVTTQAQILDLLRDLQRETGMAMVLVSHDLGLIAESCARVAVMYAGRIVEQGPTAEIFATPRHPYTRGLLASLPRIEHVVARLATMPGALPQPGQLPPGCSFAPRCDRATPACEAGVPRLEQHGARALRCLHPQDDPPAGPGLVQVAAGAETLGAPMVEAQALGLRYAPRRLLGLFARGAAVQAVDGVSFTLHRGETLGLVGESGCGKSTVARMVAGLLTPSAGELRFAAERGAAPGVPAPRFAQLVFQDPLGALDPRQRIGAQIAEPMEIHRIGDAASRRAEVLRLLQAVGLDAALADAFPHRLSGGQRQRVVLARALALRPPMLIADEPFSALDVSVQAQVIEVLAALQAREALTLLFISHDLRVVRRICGRVAVMYAGRIVESAPAALLFATPQHPYTKALLAAVPTPEVGVRRLHQPLPGEPPSPLRPPTGCRFHPRCAQARPLCRVEAPALHGLTPGQAVACHVVHGDA